MARRLPRGKTPRPRTAGRGHRRCCERKRLLAAVRRSPARLLPVKGASALMVVLVPPSAAARSPAGSKAIGEQRRMLRVLIADHDCLARCTMRTALREDDRVAIVPHRRRRARGATRAPRSSHRPTSTATSKHPAQTRRPLDLLTYPLRAGPDTSVRRRSGSSQIPPKTIPDSLAAARPTASCNKPGLDPNPRRGSRRQLRCRRLARRGRNGGLERARGAQGPRGPQGPRGGTGATGGHRGHGGHGGTGARGHGSGGWLMDWPPRPITQTVAQKPSQVHEELPGQDSRWNTRSSHSVSSTVRNSTEGPHANG
jgi:hypothetical protein